MDPLALAGMVFTLLVILMIGGFILLFPVSRRLGKVLERWLEEKRPGGKEPEIAQLRAAVQALEREVRSLSERQDFVESLSLGDDRPALPPAEAGSPDRPGRLPGA
jgi:cell division protein FtsB